MMAEERIASAESYLGRISRLCGEFRLEALSPQLAAVREQIREQGVIAVAVVGGFKAGKSSFINAVLGRELMPVAVLPATAVITRVRYGPGDRADVCYLDGRIEPVALERIGDFIAEPRNPRNEKQVARVEVESAALAKFAPLQFIDTPGMGSVFIHNTLTSKEWLPRVGAALLTVSADRPLAETDVSLLKDLDQYTPEIAILVTKADLVSPRDLQEVTAFIRQQSEHRLGKTIRILPFSIRPGYESARQTVLDYLGQSLAAESSRRAGEIIRHKLRTLAAGLREYLGLALAAAAAKGESRLALQRQLEHEKAFSSAIQNEIRVISGDVKSRLQAAARRRFQAASRPLMERLTEELRPRLRDWKGNLEKTTRAFRDWAGNRLAGEMERISEKEGPPLADQYLREALASFSRMVQAFQDRLSQAIAAALGMRFAGAQFEARVEAPRHPDLHIGRIFDTPWESFWFVIPMRLLRPWFNRHFMNLLPWETEKNLSRLAAQWAETSNRSVDDLAGQAAAFIRDELHTIEQLLAKAEDRREELENAAAETDRLAGELAEEPAL